MFEIYPNTMKIKPSPPRISRKIKQKKHEENHSH